MGMKRGAPPPPPPARPAPPAPPQPRKKAKLLAWGPSKGDATAAPAEGGTTAGDAVVLHAAEPAELETPRLSSVLFVKGLKNS